MRAEIDGGGDEVFAAHNHIDALSAVIDKHKTACLFAVTPDCNTAVAGIFGLNHLATDSGRGLFSSAVPNRAMNVLRPLSAQYSWQNISDISFSQP